MSLQDKTALITGSGGGLGRTIAQHLLSLGANVVICDIHEERLANARLSIESAFPNQALILQVDVTDEASVKHLISESIARFGSLDIVVNNAAIMDRFDPAAECDLKTWERVLAVNLTGPFLITKHVLPHMQAQAKSRQLQNRGEGKDQAETAAVPDSVPDGGLIINIGSVCSFAGLCGGVAYTASKHGILALTKNTAGSYGHQGVSCVALVLGGMKDTNIVDAFVDGFNMDGFNLMNQAVPGQKLIPMEHVARYVAFLSADRMGKSVNGSCINVTSNWPPA